jgi:hypothetical protein
MQVRYAGCLLAALLLSACGGGSDDKTTAASGPQRLDVTARDFALKINGSAALRPGPVTITARNSGEQAHGMVLVKLNDRVGRVLAGNDHVRPRQLRDARRRRIEGRAAELHAPR